MFLVKHSSRLSSIQTNNVQMVICTSAKNSVPNLMCTNHKNGFPYLRLNCTYCIRYGNLYDTMKTRS